jgi:hypothetical protein
MAGIVERTAGRGLITCGARGLKPRPLACKAHPRCPAWSRAWGRGLLSIHLRTAVRPRDQRPAHRGRRHLRPRDCGHRIARLLADALARRSLPQPGGAFDLGALGGTRTPTLLIRRLCHRRRLPGRWRLTCSDASHWVASLFPVTRCCPAKIRPTLPRLPQRLSMRTTGGRVV